MLVIFRTLIVHGNIIENNPLAINRYYNPGSYRHTSSVPDMFSFIQLSCEIFKSLLWHFGAFTNLGDLYSSCQKSLITLNTGPKFF